MSESETIMDIVREMREHLSKDELGHRLGLWLDRIEAAYNRLAIPTAEQWTEFARQGSEIAELKRRLNDMMPAMIR